MGNDTLPQPADKHSVLALIDPADTHGKKKNDVEEQTKNDQKSIYDQHYLMYAENKHALLIIFQGIDASGKDGVVRHLAKGMNPQGVKIHSFKEPSSVELDHDYLWRIHQAVPGRGEIGMFNRSHYEEVVSVKVHREFIAAQHLPDQVANDPKLFAKRYRQINDFERMLDENGISVLKFFLHITPDEQLKRFEKRLTNRKKHWKFSEEDLEKRKFWDEYMDAFQKMIRETSMPHAPWYIIPADKKWYRNYLVGRIVEQHLQKLDMKFPDLNGANGG